MKKQKRMLFLLTIIIQTIALSGCSFNEKNMVYESTEVFTEDVTHVMTYEDPNGEKEIFVSFSPSVNSMPLEEWFVLKRKDSGWELLEMYHQNDDMTQNTFPISIALKEKEFLFSITCDGCEKEIIYDATAHYETMKQDTYLSDTYKAFVDGNFKAGDEVGYTSAWGIWDIKSGLYQEKNCLIA